MKATLTFSHWWRGQFDEYIPMMQQKTGIAIEQDKSGGDVTKLITQFVAGTAPDLFLIDAPANGDLFPTGNLLPFDDYLKSRSDVDMTKWNVDPVKEVGYQGKIMALSLFVMQDLIVHVNQELADKDGLLKDAPLWGKDNFDTWTWDKFVEWLKAGTKVKSDGTVDQFGISGFGFDPFARAFLAQTGGQIFDDDWNYQETKSMADQPAFLQGVQFPIDLTLKHKVAATPAVEQSIKGGAYAAKRTLCAISWSTPSIWPVEQFFPQTYFHLPYNGHKIHAISGNHIGVFKGTKFRDAAFEWVTTFTVDKDVRTKFLQISSVPAYDPLPIVQASPEGLPKTIALINLSRIQGFSTLPKDTEGVTLYARYYGRKASAFTRKQLQTAFEAAITGKSTVEQSFGDAKKRIDEELAKKK
jgi:ABC-type glycerol-3-phosphate transport system substrate-binding protein